jgi:hypothetical protein
MSDNEESLPHITISQTGIYLQPTQESATTTSKPSYSTPSLLRESLEPNLIEKPLYTIPPTEADKNYFSQFREFTQQNSHYYENKLDTQSSSLLDFYDTFQVAKFYFLSIFGLEHLSFAKDYIKYKRNYKLKTLPPETQRLSSEFVVRTMYRAHLARSMKFFPVALGLLEGPYLLSGVDRWTPEQYTLTSGILGLYWGVLTKRTPLFLAACTVVPAFTMGIYGYLEDLRGRPFLAKAQFIGKRRTSDNEAQTVIQRKGLGDKIHI